MDNTFLSGRVCEQHGNTAEYCGTLSSLEYIGPKIASVSSVAPWVFCVLFKTQVVAFGRFIQHIKGATAALSTSALSRAFGFPEPGQPPIHFGDHKLTRAKDTPSLIASLHRSPLPIGVRYSNKFVIQQCYR